MTGSRARARTSRWTGALLLIGLWLPRVAPAQTAAAGPTGGELPAIAVDELTAGSRGWGLSVFRGGEPERFEVEILGVLRDVQPGTSYVLGRLTGQGLEKTGVIAGMSGSPVYVGERLVGAVAFAWPFAHEAIAGITPIGAMRAIADAAPWKRPLGQPRSSLADISARSFPADALGAAVAALAGPAGPGGRPALLWGATGFADSTVATLGRWLPSLAAAGVAGRGSGEPNELAAGVAVAQVWIDGDLRLAATGTVTERSGDRVLAFGHPVTGQGDVAMPMAAAEVITVLSSAASSFKLANTGAVVGAFERDHPAGALGRINATAPTLPLAVRVAGPVPHRFALRLARVPALLPTLAAIGTLGALDVAAPVAGLEGLDLRLALDLGGDGRLELVQSFDGEGAGIQAVLFLLATVDFLTRTDLAAVDLRGVEVDLVPFAEPRVETLVGLHAERAQVEPGDTLELLLDVKPWRGEAMRRRLPVTLPPDLPAGRYTLLVGDGASADAARLAIEPVEPVTFAQALALLRSLGSAKQLVVLGVLSGRGLATGGEVLPRLPASMRSIWGVSGTRNATPLRLAVAQFERTAQEIPLAGLLRIDLEVRRQEPVKGEPTRPITAGASTAGAKKEGR